MPPVKFYLRFDTVGRRFPIYTLPVERRPSVAAVSSRLNLWQYLRRSQRIRTRFDASVRATLPSCQQRTASICLWRVNPCASGCKLMRPASAEKRFILSMVMLGEPGRFINCCKCPHVILVFLLHRTIHSLQTWRKDCIFS